MAHRTCSSAWCLIALLGDRAGTTHPGVTFPAGAAGGRGGQGPWEDVGPDWVAGTVGQVQAPHPHRLIFLPDIPVPPS